MPSRLILLFVLGLALCGCAASTPNLPYPAFIQTDDIPDVFMATLPGVRAKRYVEDYATRTGRYRIDLPPSWSGTSGGIPNAALELFVLEGELTVGDIKLIPGGYAYLPSGSLGFRLASGQGARILYLMSGEDPASVIRSPLILDGVESEWQEIAPGISHRVLRSDPGSGARTWLLKTTSAAEPVWRSSTTTREGHLVSGSHTMSECHDGKVKTGRYAAGGYFLRPANTIFGGAETGTERESIWFLSESAAATVTATGLCIRTEPDE
ncbi:MAG: hypothetical protein AAFX56_18105 [Pseudomonadota bacterium]